MAAELKQQQHELGGAAGMAEPSVARRLWRVVRAVLYMLRRGLPPSGRKLAMDLRLLLHRGKIAGKKALQGGRFLASHHHHHHHPHAGGGAAGRLSSCGALDPALAVHEPSRRRREVEFSCSNTPSSVSGGGGLGFLGAAARRRRRHRDEQTEEAVAGGFLSYSGYDAAEVARVFEMLSDEDGDGDERRLFSDDDAVPVLGASSATTTPSPALLRLAAAGSSWQARLGVGSATSPAADGGAAGQVDRRADEFIRRFYEQLRAQRERSAASTPDCHGYAASPYGAGAAARAVAAGIS